MCTVFSGMPRTPDLETFLATLTPEQRALWEELPNEQRSPHNRAISPDHVPDWAAPFRALVETAPIYTAAPIAEFLAALDPASVDRVPRFTLMCLCEAVEAVVRFVVIARLAELAASKNGLPDRLKTALRDMIQRPTFGVWSSALEQTADAAETEGGLLPELHATKCALVLLLRGRPIEADGTNKNTRQGEAQSADSDLIGIRNALAHGTVSQTHARKLLDLWGPRVGHALQSLTFLNDVELWTCDPDGVRRLRGRAPDGIAATPPEILRDRLGPGDVVLRRGERVVWLTPFGRRTPVSTPGRPIAQLFIRRELYSLVYALIGSDDALQAEGDEAGLKRFLDIFDLGVLRHRLREGSFPERLGFEHDVESDAAQFIGRTDDLEKLKQAVFDTLHGAIWVPGEAGMGKSMLLARVAFELSAEARAHQSANASGGGWLIATYRFRAGDAMCAALPFYRWLIARLDGAEGDAFLRKTRFISDLREKAKNLLSTHAGERIVLFLDGLDEIERREPGFSQETLLRLLPQAKTALLVFAGRPEGVLPGVMAEIGARVVLGGNLRPMSKPELRELIDQRLPQVAKRFVREDLGDEATRNEFIDRLRDLSEGVPIYVELVLRDIRNGRFRRFNAREAEDLVELQGYFARILDRVGAGDLAIFRQLVLCLIALALEPLSRETLAALVRREIDRGSMQLDLTRAAIDDLGGLLRRTHTPDGEEGFRLHTKLADMVRNSEGISGTREKAKNIFLLAAAAHSKEDMAQKHVPRCAVQYLVEAGRAAEAAALLANVEHQISRLRILAPQGGDAGIGGDWFRLLAVGAALTTEQSDWQRFWTANGARFNAEPGASGARDLVECALTYASDTRIGRAFSSPEVTKYRPILKPLFGERRRFGAELAVLCQDGGAIWGALELRTTRILSWFEDGTLRLWTADGEPIGLRMRHDDHIRGAIELNDGSILSWSDDGTLRLWSSEGDPLAPPMCHERYVKGAMQLKDGRILSWGDHTLHLWGSRGKPESEPIHHGAVVDGAMELKSGALLSWSDKIIRTWTMSGDPVSAAIEHTGLGNVAHPLELKDGHILYWSDSWDYALRLSDTHGQPIGQPMAHQLAVRGAIQLNDGSILSWSGDRTLRRWNTTGQPIGDAMRHDAGVLGAVELKNGRILSWSADRTMHLWEVASDAVTKIIMGASGDIRVAFELNNGRILSWSDRPLGSLEMWSADGKPVKGPTHNVENVHGLVRFESGRIISWSVAYSAQWRWNVASKHVLQLWNPEGEPIGGPLHGHTEEPINVIELTNGNILSWAKDNSLRLWTPTAAGSPRVRFRALREQLTVMADTFLNGGSLDTRRSYEGVVGAILLSSGSILSWSKGTTLQLWSADGREASKLLRGHTGVMRGAMELRNGHILSWSADNTLQLWTPGGAPLGKPMRQNTGMQAFIRSVLYSNASPSMKAIELPSGRILSQSDKTLRVWYSDGKPLGQTMYHDQPVQGATELKDGRILAWTFDYIDLSDSSQGEVRQWTPAGEPIGKTMRQGGLRGATELIDGSILSWSTRELRRWNRQGDPIGESMLGEGYISGATGLRGGLILSWGSQLRVWSANGAPMRVYDREDSARHVVTLATGDLVLWTFATLRRWNCYGEQIGEMVGHEAHVEWAIELKDGRLLSWSEDRTLRLWSPQSEPIGEPLRHEAPVKGAFELNDGRILSWSANTLRLWDRDGTPISRHFIWFGNPVFPSKSPILFTDGQMLLLDMKSH